MCVVLVSVACASATWAADDVPSAPQNVVAVAGESSVTLTWQAPSSSGTSPISAYVITSDPAPMSGATTQVDGTAQTATIAGFDNGTAYTLSIVAVNASGAGPSTAAAPVTPSHPGGRYVPLTPYRVCDTRAGNPLGLTGKDDQCEGKTLASGAPLTFVVRGTKAPGMGGIGVPTASAAAVVLNVTVLSPSGPGSLTAWPAGQTEPTVTSASFAAGETRSTALTVALGSHGSVSVAIAGATSDVEVDVDGYVSTDQDPSGLFETVVPYRVCDTRTGNPSALTGPDAQCNGKTLGPAGSLDVRVAGTKASGDPNGGVPAKHVGAVLLDVTTTDSTAASSLTAWATQTTMPDVPSIQWSGSDTISSELIVPVGPGGDVSLANLAGDVDVVVDVAGWFTDGTDLSATGSYLSSVHERRICDTRPGNPSNLSGPYAQCNGSGDDGDTLGPQQTLTINAAGLAGVPNQSVDTPPVAVVMSVTATDTTTDGSIVISPRGSAPSATTALSWAAGQSATAQVVALLGSGTQLSILNDAGDADLTVDVVGYEAGATVVPSSTHVLSRASQKLLTSVAPDGSSLTFSGTNAQLASVLPGSIVATGDTRQTPGGRLLKVTDVSTSDGDLVLATAPATITDAMPEGSISYSGAPTNLAATSAARAHRSGPSASAPFGSWAGKAACGTNVSQHNFNYSFDSANFSLTPQVSGDWGLFPPHLTFAASMRLDVQLQTSLTATWTSALGCSRGINIVSDRPVPFFNTIDIGPITLTLEYGLRLVFTVSGSIQGPVTTTATTSFYAQAGFEWNNGSVSNTSGTGCDAPVPNGTPLCTQLTNHSPNPIGSFKFSVGPQFRLSLAVEGGAGSITFALQVPYVQVTIQPTVAPFWSLDVGVKFTISAQIELGGPINLSDSFTPFNWSKNIAHSVEIDTDALENAIATARYQQKLSASGVLTPYSWSFGSSHPPPPWLHISASSGTLTGMAPLSAVGKHFTFDVQATDTLSESATQPLTLTVSPPVSIATSTLPVATEGAPYLANLSAQDGTPNYAWSAGAGNPGWVTVDPTGDISATPPPGSGGPSGGTGEDYPIAVHVTDSTKPTSTAASATLSLHVVPLSVATTSLPGGSVDQRYPNPFSPAVQLTPAGGSPPYTWAPASGTTLPGWLALDPSSGDLTGTPGPTDVGTTTLTFQVTDANNITATSAPLALTVQPFQISPTTLPQAAANAPFSDDLTTIGGATPLTWSVPNGESLPSWMQLTRHGVLSGTPPPMAQGTTIDIPIQVEDSGTPVQTATATVSLPISPWAQVQGPTNYPTDGYPEQLSVSCSSATNCLFAGSFFEDDGNTPSASRWNGTAWTTTAMPMPAGAKGASIERADCPTLKFCASVGWYYPKPLAQPLALIEQWNGTSWAIVPAPDQNSGEQLDDVSCPSAKYCMASGTIGADSAPYFARWDGNSWAEIPAPDTGGVVSCDSPDDCTAVGGAASAHWNGATWGKDVDITLRAGLENYSLDWNDVACTAVTNCNATGNAWYQEFERPLLEHWNGVTWTDEIEGDQEGRGYQAMSCPRTDFCAGTTGYEIDFWDGVTWSRSIAAAQLAPIAALDCASDKDCLAIGVTSNAGVDSFAALTYHVATSAAKSTSRENGASVGATTDAHRVRARGGT